MKTERVVKQNILRVIRLAGGFTICRRYNAHALRILCYHGISLDDEHRFQGKLFMSASLFRRRMQWLKSRGFRTIDLGEAVSAMYKGSLPKNAIVITFDDGWYGVHKYALPILAELGFKATLYSSTYYSEKGTVVFNLFVPYVLWRSKIRQLDLAGLGYGLKGRFSLDVPKQRETVTNWLIQVGEEKLGADDRHALAMNIADRLGEDGRAMERRRIMTFARIEELSDWVQQGMDIQLHTHTHNLKVDDDELIQSEIRRNRRALKNVVDREFSHLCYPSGIYDAGIFPCLESIGIRTATTTKSGFNYTSTHPLELSRFLDGEDVSDIEFHAEMAGVLELLRRGRSALALTSA